MYKFLLIIVMCLFIILLYFDKKIPEHFQNNEIPKIIWAYWDSDEIPDIVKLSIQSWKKTSPQYKINFMNQKNIEALISLPKNWKTLPAYRQSDIIRLLLLEKYGGVWIDASTILLENLDKLISKNNLTLFTTPRSSFENPVFENWFISAPPNNKVIKLWIEEVLMALSNQKEYINKSSDYSKKHINNPYYHICHLSLKNIYEKNKKLFDGAKIYDSNETAFYYQRNTPNLKYLFKNKFDKSKLMIKLTGTHRKYIDLQYFDKSLIA
jgi:hypothetical protein